MPDEIQIELKDLEHLILLVIAKSDLSRAYRRCLKNQTEYAATPDEKIRLLLRRNSILNNERFINATEDDFVNEAWSPIMRAAFNNDALILKWGDTISETSKDAKKRALPNDDVLGDRVDLRMLVKTHDTMILSMMMMLLLSLPMANFWP